ncbi:MAG TPA: SAM-dependent methyltransferase, partial [Candidatus Tectomicrobia bacterium]|nr:SAM-dependent methyltransferase [Candidatus Tectomicrobia bacterium]
IAAVPAYAGIPLTHRGRSSSFAVVTGHEACGAHGSGVDWRLAGTADTLVVFMGLRTLPRVVARLVAHGRPPETPVALVHAGTTAAQRTIVGTLADIVSRAEAAALEPPVLAVVGDVVTLRERLRWFGEQERARAPLRRAL